MTKTRFASFLIFLVLVISGHHAIPAPPEPRAIGIERPGRNLLYAHVVLEGTVESVAIRKVLTGDVRTRTGWPSLEMDVCVVRLTDSALLRGGDAKSDVLVDVVVHPERLIGKRVILCGQWKPKLGNYFVSKEWGGYVRTIDGWLSLDARETLSDEAVASAIKSVSIQELTQRSDIVAIGRVEELVDSAWTSSSGSRIQARIVHLRVQQVLKGNYRSVRISFLTIVSGLDTPAWRTPIPVQIAVGETWFVFLNDEGRFYRPVDGLNGLLLVDGDEVLYDRLVRCRLSKSRLVSAVQDASREQ